MTALRCTDSDPEHVHDDEWCCECGAPDHCCGDCPVFVGPSPYKRFHIDSLEGPSAVEEFARDLFGSDTTVGIRDARSGMIILYCHESMVRKMLALLEKGNIE